jgi:endonuclease-3
MKANTQQAKTAKKIITLLMKEYPQAGCSLIFKNPHQLVVATILSAQSTDDRVNMTTPELFKKYRSPVAFAKANLENLMEMIKPVGLYRNKAKAIKNCMAMVVNEYEGEIPADMDKLMKLPGVGRKTANVILNNAYNIPSGIAVDTHVKRISKLLGWTEHTDPLKIEADLMELLPKKEWIMISHRLIFHGRAVCIARRPKCSVCVLSELCPSSTA